MGNTENLLIQIKVDHHQFVGNLQVEGQLQNESLLIHLAIYQAAEPLGPQKIHHLDKGQLGWVGSWILLLFIFSSNIRYINLNFTLRCLN